MEFRIGGVTFKRETSGALHLRWRNGTMRFGKAPYPEPDAHDVMSRLARAYGIRRDYFDVRNAIRDQAGLERGASWAVDNVIHAVIDADGRDPGVVDRLAAGEGIPERAKERAVNSSGRFVQNPEEVVDSVLAEMARALQADAPDAN